jgi:CarboxypepD_reg-like domain/TonB-dependent Receptor Plug Domain
MKKTLQIISTLLVINTSLLAQTSISGIITDQAGETLVGANIYLDGTYAGASSQIDGSFQFTSEEHGAQTLVVSFIGYEEVRLRIQIASQPLYFDIKLKEAIDKIDGVVITAGSFQAGGETKREVLKSLDIVTTAGATADIAGALNTLPGTQTVGEEGRLFVRGGDGNETKTFIDGLMVFKPYGTTVPNTPSRSRFSPFMFSGTSFSTGGYSAEYGQALSSTLNLVTKDKQSQTRTDISIMSVGLEAAHNYSDKKSSVAGKVSYINLKPYYTVVPQQIDWLKQPATLEANAAYHYEFNNNGILKAYGKYSTSTMLFNDYSIDQPEVPVSTAIDNDYFYGNASYRKLLTDKWSVMTGAAVTRNTDEYRIDQDRVNEDLTGSHLKISFFGDLTTHFSLHMGAESIIRESKQRFTRFSDGFINDWQFKESLLAGFAEADVFFTNNLVARVGARVEASRLNSTVFASPRVSLAYKVSENGQFSLAAGSYQQATQDKFLWVAPGLKYEKANHYIINYQFLDDNRTFRVEAYYKTYKDLVKYDPATFYDPASYNNSGSGYARGIDIFWRDNKTIKNADYWVSYSYLDTERDYLDFPAAARPTFTSKHNFSVVYKHFVSALKTQFSGTYTFGSGRPYNNPNTNKFNNGLTPEYHDLSLSVSYLATQNIIIHGSVTNILGRDNVFGYEYASQQDLEGIYQRRATELPAPRFIFVGIFITLSKEGTLNQMQSL